MRASAPSAPGADVAIHNAGEDVAVLSVSQSRAGSGHVVLGGPSAVAVREVPLVHSYVMVEFAFASNVASLAVDRDVAYLTFALLRTSTAGLGAGGPSSPGIGVAIDRAGTVVAAESLSGGTTGNTAVFGLFAYAHVAGDGVGTSAA